MAPQSSSENPRISSRFDFYLIRKRNFSPFLFIRKKRKRFQRYYRWNVTQRTLYLRCWAIFKKNDEDSNFPSFVRVANEKKDKKEIATVNSLVLLKTKHHVKEHHVFTIEQYLKNNEYSKAFYRNYFQSEFSDCRSRRLVIPVVNR